MKNALVSIIITCYNQAHCIAQTIESVKAQTYKQWECIIVDDGSKDTSAGVIQETIGKDQRFKYVFQDNQGVAKARNLGFAMAKGELINFLDGDDTFLPLKIELQTECFEENRDLYICICDHQYYHVQTNNYKYHKFEPIKIKPLEQLLYGWHNGIAFPPHAPLYKRSLWSLNEIPFPEDYKYRCEDWVFNVLVALKNQNYCMLHKVLCNYHMDTGNFTADTKRLAKASIMAAYYINPLIPKYLKKDFIEVTMDNTFNMFLASEKPNILNASGNWRLGNRISKPILSILKYFNSI